MNRRATGVTFCFISAFLYATYYIAGAISKSNLSSILRDESFNDVLEYIGRNLPNFSIISLIVGIAYLIIAEIAEIRK